MKKTWLGCATMALVLMLGSIAYCGDISQAYESVFDLPSYQKIQINGVIVFKSCKEVPSDHPLRSLFINGGPIYQLEFTEEYVAMKKSSEPDTMLQTLNLLWPPSGIYGEEWIAQNEDTRVYRVEGLYSGYRCEMIMQHLQNPKNRVFIPYWQYNPSLFRWEKHYLPMNYWIDQWFYWTDTYLLDGDQTGYFTQMNAFKLDQSYGGKGCWDHVVSKTQSVFNGHYLFDRIWPHQNIGDHADYQYALPAQHNPWPDYVYNFDLVEDPLPLRYWIHDFGQE